MSVVRNAPNVIRRLRAIFGNVCWLCGGGMDKRTHGDGNENACTSIDHVVPLIHGGSNCIDNLRLAHKYCNRVRGSARWDEDSSDRMFVIYPWKSREQVFADTQRRHYKDREPPADGEWDDLKKKRTTGEVDAPVCPECGCVLVRADDEGLLKCANDGCVSYGHPLPKVEP